MNISLGKIPDALLSDVAMARMVPVRQSFDLKQINPECIPRVIQDQFQRRDIRERVRPGMRVAIGVGSRGISHLADIVRTLVDELKQAGAHPFIVPAMGSHGSATAEGQEQLLAEYGIVEDRVGAPIRACIDTVRLGQVWDGVEVHIDRIAYEEADGIIVVSRIKPHTDFKSSIESGIMKMLAIGLGKHNGAMELHRLGMQRFGELLPAAGQWIMSRTPFLFGAAIIENACHAPAHIELVPREQLPGREEELLVEAKRLMPRFWVSDIDVLIIDEIGKNISGSGMDPNIIGRSGSNPSFGSGPSVGKIVVRGLTGETRGSAVGIGIADFTTARVVDGIDFAATYTNVITAMDISGGKLPIILRNDREAIAAAVKLSGRQNTSQASIVRIRNTLEMQDIMLSESLLSLVAAHPMIEVTGPAVEWDFDENGFLKDI